MSLGEIVSVKKDTHNILGMCTGLNEKRENGVYVQVILLDNTEQTFFFNKNELVYNS